MEKICTVCQNKTILFRGKGLDTEYYICPHYKEAGHLTEKEINQKLIDMKKLLLHGGRWA